MPPTLAVLTVVDDVKPPLGSIPPTFELLTVVLLVNPPFGSIPPTFVEFETNAKIIATNNPILRFFVNTNMATFYNMYITVYA